MTRVNLHARMRNIVLLSKAKRQHARADCLAANAALERAEALVTLQAGHRDAALDLWSEILSDPLAVPLLVTRGGAWVLEHEQQLHEAERATEAARLHSERVALTFAEASARDEVAQTVRVQEIRRHDRHDQELFTSEAQDLLLHRRQAR